MLGEVSQTLAVLIQIVALAQRIVSLAVRDSCILLNTAQLARNLGFEARKVGGYPVHWATRWRCCPAMLTLKREQARRRRSTVLKK